MAADATKQQGKTPTDREQGLSLRRSLLVISGSGAQSHVLPDEGEVVLGRAHECDVILSDASISRRHARLRLDEPMSIEDLGSANGVRVRGQRLARGEVAPISVDELVELGQLMISVRQRSGSGLVRRIWSHDYLEGRLAEECVRAARTGNHFALCHLHAPDGWDDAVREVLVQQLRAFDVVAVYAPGEHEVLLVDADADAARIALARITTELTARGVAVRVGLAVFPHDGRSSDALLARAAAGGTEEEGHGRLVVTDAMQNLLRLVDRIAPGTLSVLIVGETGVGKEVMAQTIHERSPRAARPLVSINCAALSETLLESELFGHEKGAFTGATQTKPGLIETADGGTLFLDELGEMPPALQVKLLRVLEQRQVLRVGGRRPRDVDVRFLAATNRDLEAEVERGAFRQDLLFRLNAITLTIPPLRERRGEIEGLARAFISAACRELGREREPGLAAEALEVLHAYSWPGNIRELRNVAQRAVLLCGDEITVEHLPLTKMRATITAAAAHRPVTPTTLPVPQRPPLGLAPAAPPAAAEVEELRSQLRAAERAQILDALAQCAGNQTRAARLLGISLRTLVNRLDEHAIPRPRRKRARPRG